MGDSDFDFDLNNDVGTSVSKLKQQSENFQTISKNTDTEINYEDIVENLKNSDTFTPPTQNYENNIEKFSQTIKDVRPRKLNMNQFAKTLESDLENFQNFNLNEPLPSNLSKKMISKVNENFKPVVVNPKPVQIIEKLDEEEKEESNYLTKILNFENRDIILYVLIFMLLNNKFIIEFIYNNIPFVKKSDSTIPNLFLRSLLFGGSIFIIRKFM
jgi:DNA-binding transcriptional regulator YiaG